MLADPQSPAPIIVISKAALAALVAEAVARGIRQSDETKGSEPERGFGWVTNKEAMRLLGLSKPTLARYRANGTLPYSKVGSSVYYRLADVEALLEARLVRSAGR